MAFWDTAKALFAPFAVAGSHVYQSYEDTAEDEELEKRNEARRQAFREDPSLRSAADAVTGITTDTVGTFINNWMSPSSVIPHAIESGKDFGEAAVETQRGIEEELLRQGKIGTTEESVTQAQKEYQQRQPDDYQLKTAQKYAPQFQVQYDAEGDYKPLYSPEEQTQRLLQAQKQLESAINQNATLVKQREGIKQSLLNSLPEMGAQVTPSTQPGVQVQQVPTKGAKPQNFQNSLRVIGELNKTLSGQGSDVGGYAQNVERARKAVGDSEKDIFEAQEMRRTNEAMGRMPSKDRVVIKGEPYKRVGDVNYTSLNGREDLYISPNTLDKNGKLPADLQKEITGRIEFSKDVTRSMSYMTQILRQAGPVFDPSVARDVVVVDPFTGEKQTVNAAAVMQNINFKLITKIRPILGGPLDQQMGTIISYVVVDPIGGEVTLKALGTNEIERLIDASEQFSKAQQQDVAEYLQLRGIKTESDVYRDMLKENPNFGILEGERRYVAPDKKYYLIPEGSGDMILFNDKELLEYGRIVREQQEAQRFRPKGRP